MKQISEALQEDQSVVLPEFEKRAQAEQERYDDATNSRFYCCLCFQSQEQMIEFKHKTGFDKITDKIFIDGMKAAKALGIELTSLVPPVRKGKKKSGYEEFPSVGG